MPSREYYLDSMGVTRWRLRSVPEKSEPIAEDLSIVWFEQKPNPTIGFFTEITNGEEQKLLVAIVQACAKDEMYNVGTFTDDLHAPLSGFQKVLIFGVAQAQRLNPDFKHVGLYDLSGSKIFVTYSLQELTAEPARKRELWQTWQQLSK
jgi:hypothetical protein